MTVPVEIAVAAFMFVVLTGLYPHPLRGGAHWRDVGLCALANAAVWGAGLSAFVLVEGMLSSPGGRSELLARLLAALAAIAAVVGAGALTRRMGWLTRAGKRVAAARHQAEQRVRRGESPEGPPLVFRE